MKRFSGLLSPTNWLYILAHLCLILLGFGLLGTQSSAAREVGGALVAAGIAGWVILAYVLQSQKLKEQIKIVTNFGFVSAFEGRSVRIRNEYDKRLATVSDKIDIVGFGLKTLRQDYLNEFKVWKARASVRILLIDPHFPEPTRAFADQRDAEENDRPGTIREDVEAFIQEVEPHLDRKSTRSFELRLYRCLPSVNLFRVDGELFWGPYLVHQQSRNSPTFIVNEGPLFKALIAHFETIWTSPVLSCSLAEYRHAQTRAVDDSN